MPNGVGCFKWWVMSDGYWVIKKIIQTNPKPHIDIDRRNFNARQQFSGLSNFHKDILRTLLEIKMCLRQITIKEYYLLILKSHSGINLQEIRNQIPLWSTVAFVELGICILIDMACLRLLIYFKDLSMKWTLHFKEKLRGFKSGTEMRQENFSYHVRRR